MGGLNEAIMEAEASAIPTHGTRAILRGHPRWWDTQL